MNKQNLVYILRCSNNSYYTGWTNDFIKRMKAHEHGTASHYTHAFVPIEVVYIERFETKSDAMKKEAAIKKMTRRQKEELISHRCSETTEFLNCFPFKFKGE